MWAVQVNNTVGSGGFLAPKIIEAAGVVVAEVVVEAIEAAGVVAVGVVVVVVVVEAIEAVEVEAVAVADVEVVVVASRQLLVVFADVVTTGRLEVFSWCCCGSCKNRNSS